MTSPLPVFDQIMPSTVFTTPGRNSWRYARMAEDGPSHATSKSSLARGSRRGVPPGRNLAHNPISRIEPGGETSRFDIGNSQGGLAVTVETSGILVYTDSERSSGHRSLGPRRPTQSNVASLDPFGTRTAVERAPRGVNHSVLPLAVVGPSIQSGSQYDLNPLSPATVRLVLRQ